MLEEVDQALQALEAVQLEDQEDPQEQKQRRGEVARRKAELQFNHKRNSDWVSTHAARRQALAGRWRGVEQRRLARLDYYHALIDLSSGTTPRGAAETDE